MYFQHNVSHKSDIAEWILLHAYFINETQEQKLMELAENEFDFFSSALAQDRLEEYCLFNRKLPWSPASENTNKNSWLNAELIIEQPDTFLEPPYLSQTAKEILMNFISQKKIPNDLSEIPQKEAKEIINFLNYADQFGHNNTDISIKLGKVLHSSIRMIWETATDKSIPEHKYWYIPCYDVINEMNLQQKEYDFIFYDPSNKLASFDTELINLGCGTVIRKDILDSFLIKKNMKIIWIMQAEKYTFLSKEYMKPKQRTSWTGLYTYDGKKTKGKIYMAGIEE